MPAKYTRLDDELYAYVVEHGAGEDEVLAALREQTAAMGDVAAMQIAPEQGALLALLARLLGARRALEVGTFTGYSAISVARALPADGRLVACELSEDYAAIARRHFAAAGVEDRIELRLGPAAETLAALGGGEPFDFAFVDADKAAYPGYYEACLGLLRPGGLVALDNMLLGGRVLDPAADDEGARAIDELNRTIAADSRVDSVLLGIADGVTLARRR